MRQLTSPHNPHVKNVLGLRDRKHRQQQRQIVIDGVRELSRALAAGVQLVEAFICPPLCRTDQALQLVERLAAGGSELWEVSERVWEKLSFGERAEGVLAVAQTPHCELEMLAARWAQTANPLVAVLEGVEKPGNLGAVLRSADAAGVSALIAADPRTDLYNPNAIRASLGTIFTVPVATASSSDTLAWLRRQQLAIYAARVDGSQLYTQVDYRRPAAIVLGSEAEGLSDLWQAEAVTAIHLPMRGVADSLNVSATAAVLFYEAHRQRSEAA